MDFVADKRASTPTGAAELATVDRREIEQKFQYALDAMIDSIKDKLKNMKDDVSSYKEELEESIRDYLDDQKRLLKSYSDRLEALSPLKVLERGFSITEDSNGNVIQDIRQVKPGDNVTTRLNNGTIYSRVDKVEEK